MNSPAIATRLVPRAHPLHGLAVYLARLQAGRPFLHPREFDIVACRRFAGWIHLADVIDGGERPDCMFAVYAGGVAQIVECDYQGQCASQIADQGRREQWFELLERILERRAPEFAHDVTRGPIRPGGPPNFDRLVWPMSSDGQTIDRVLVAIHPA
jgi:hypothetical protein